MASIIAGKKKEEGDAFLMQGDKCVATHLFRWKPDWEGAALAYAQAATAYKAGKLYAQAKESFKKNATANDNLKFGFTAGKCLEEAALMAVAMKQPEEAAQLYEEAATRFGASGSHEKAAEVLTEAAKLIGEGNIEKSIDLASTACDLFEAGNKEHYLPNALMKLGCLQVSGKRYEDAIESFRKAIPAYNNIEQPHNSARVVLYVTVVRLAQGDLGAAQRDYDELSGQVSGIVATNEWNVAGELIQNIEQGNKDGVQDLVKRKIHIVKDSCIAQLMKNLGTAGLTGTTSTGSVDPEDPEDVC